MRKMIAFMFYILQKNKQSIRYCGGFFLKHGQINGLNYFAVYHLQIIISFYTEVYGQDHISLVLTCDLFNYIKKAYDICEELFPQ